MAFQVNVDWGMLGQAGTNMVNSSTQLATQMMNPENSAVAQMQKAQMQSQQVKAQQFDLAQKKFQVQGQIFGSVALNPGPDSYANALNSARSMGVDMSDAPQQWGPQAQSYVQGKLLQSGQGLEYLKAQAQLAMMGPDMMSKAASANAESAKAGQPLPFPNGLPGSNMQGLLGNFAIGRGAGTDQSQNQSNALTSTSAGPAVQQSLAAGGNGMAQVGNNVPGSTSLQSPAELKSQTEQATDWQKYKAGLQAGGQSYIQNKLALQQAYHYANEAFYTGPLSIPGTSKEDANGAEEGLQSRLAKTLPAGSALDVAGTRLNLNSIASFTKAAGISRLDIPLVKAARYLAPGTDKYPSVNKMEINALNLSNEVGNASNMLATPMEQAGIRDPNAAIGITQKAIMSTQSVNPTTGEIDYAKFHQWSNNLPAQLKVLFDKQNPEESLLSKVPTNQLTTLYSKGYSDQDIVAGIQKLTGQPIVDKAPSTINTTTQQPINPTTNNQQKPVNSPVAPVSSIQIGQDIKGSPIKVDSAVPQIAQAISKQESGHNYNAIGPATDQGRAYGRYQILASNIPKWSKEILGTPVTVAQFMANPALQDQIAMGKMQEYYNKYKNVKDVASMWFSGRPAKGNNSYDAASGMGNQNYVANVSGNYQTALAGVRD